jgi:hypothetical protein
MSILLALALLENYVTWSTESSTQKSFASMHFAPPDLGFSCSQRLRQRLSNSVAQARLAQPHKASFDASTSVFPHAFAAIFKPNLGRECKVVRRLAF